MPETISELLQCTTCTESQLNWINRDWFIQVAINVGLSPHDALSLMNLPHAGTAKNYLLAYTKQMCDKLQKNWVSPTFLYVDK